MATSHDTGCLLAKAVSSDALKHSCLHIACLGVVPVCVSVLVWRLVWGQPVLKYRIRRQRADKECDAG